MFKKLFASRSENPSAPTAAAEPATPMRARTGVLDLTKKAAFSLSKNGLDGQRAAVYLVLDRSGSMRPFYRDGTMQYLGEQALGLPTGGHRAPSPASAPALQTRTRAVFPAKRTALV
ncbi:hypothetical protein [Streptomyces prasinopilosus]|uniref:VWA domain-containing protein n=1 Tax=Streptomyces prasinopilosus TaxID=67344 RepID=A0A1G6Y5U4_9ACTN|nr:hypothetical protein SAMN05216505_112192 [Streptomyces prasinopilosus]